MRGPGYNPGDPSLSAPGSGGPGSGGPGFGGSGPGGRRGQGIPDYRSRSRKRRKRVRRLLTTLTVLLVVLLALAGGGYAYAQYRYHQIKKVHVAGLKNSAGTAKSINILMVGDNSRCALQKYSKFYQQEKSHFGSCSNVGGGRSDVVMVAHLDPATHTGYLLSLPRDLWLPMPGGNGLELRVDDALNSAETPYLHLPFGPSLLVQAVEQDLGIPINDYIELNFYTFEQVVNTLGGVSLYFPTELKDAYSGLSITHTGCIHLNGSQALALVRARHLYYMSNGTWNYDGTGDLGRIVRTHIFLRAVAAQVEHGALSNPLEANALLGSVLPDLKVNSSFSLSDMVSLVLAFRHVNPNSVPTTTLPVIVWNHPYQDPANPANYQAPGQIVLPFQPQDQANIDNLLYGTTDPSWQHISPSSITVSVVNATGQSGQAAQTASSLRALGYQIAGTSDASVTGGGPGDPFEAVVHYAPGDLSLGERVLSNIGGEAIMAQGGTTAGAQVTVTTGTDFAVTSPGSATPSATTPASTTTPPSTSAVSSSPQLSQLQQSNLWGSTHSHSQFWWDPEACGPNGGPPASTAG